VRGVSRSPDGRGGACRHATLRCPSIVWPRHATSQKRVVCSGDQAKYVQKISWADMLVLTRQRRPPKRWGSSLGFAGGEKTCGNHKKIFSGGRDQWLGDKRYTGEGNREALAACSDGLLYVNPEGTNAKPDTLAAAKDIRKLRPHGDERRGDRAHSLAGGHTFGKTNGEPIRIRTLARNPK